MKKVKRNSNFNIKGYAGYVWAIGPENLYGKSSSYLSKMVKSNPKYKFRNHYDLDPLTTVQRESYINPKNMDQEYNDVPVKDKFVIRKKGDIDKDNTMA